MPASVALYRFKMNKAYTALSKVYETLMADEAYAKWAKHVVDVLDSSSRGVLGYDLACGSGYFTRAIKRAGYDVTGVDVSKEMLTEAQKLSDKENLNIRFIEQDMATFKSFDKVDFITVINDGVNYLSPERLKKAFAAFYRQLKVEGVLFFDFSTEYKLRNVIGNNMFGEDGDDFSYLWFNRLIGDHIEMDLSVFTRVGEYYEKREESHIQYIHTLDHIVGALKAVGFSDVTPSDFSGGQIGRDTQRIEVLAVK